MGKNLRKQGGFTLVEVTIILLVLVILSTIMLPQLGNFNRLARFVKAKEDLTALCSVAKKMLDEVMHGAFYLDPHGNNHEVAPRNPVGLLVGPGAVPLEGSEGKGDDNLAAGDGWMVKAGDIPRTNCFEARPDGQGFIFGPVEFGCDYLENHLQRNDPRGDEDGTRYKNVFDDVDPWDTHGALQNTMVGGIFGWRGPYLDALTPDPWGNRYAINSFGLYADPRSDGDDIFSTAVVCYSTGPDQGIDTQMNQPQDDYPGGWVTGGDDLSVTLSAFGPF